MSTDTKIPYRLPQIRMRYLAVDDYYRKVLKYNIRNKKLKT